MSFCSHWRPVCKKSMPTQASQPTAQKHRMSDICFQNFEKISSRPVLGGYHIFMIPAGSGFIKQLIKGSGFHLFSPEIYMPGKGINNFFKSKKLVLNLPILKISRMASSPLLVLTNRVLLTNR